MTLGAFKVTITATDPATGERTLPFTMTFVSVDADAAWDEALGHPHAGPWRWHVVSATEVPMFQDAI